MTKPRIAEIAWVAFITAALMLSGSVIAELFTGGPPDTPQVRYIAAIVVPVAAAIRMWAMAGIRRDQ